MILFLSGLVGSVAVVTGETIYLSYFIPHPGKVDFYDMAGFIFRFASIVCLFAIPISIVVGVVSYSVLMFFKIFNWWSCGLIGTCAGVIVSQFDFAQWITSFGCVVLGLISSLLAWAMINSNKLFSMER